MSFGMRRWRNLTQPPLFFFCLPPPWPELLLSFVAVVACFVSLRVTHSRPRTDLGHGVATVLGVAGTLLVRRLDDEADARSSDDRRSDDRNTGDLRPGPRPRTGASTRRRTRRA